MPHGSVTGEHPRRQVICIRQARSRRRASAKGIHDFEPPLDQLAVPQVFGIEGVAFSPQCTYTPIKRGAAERHHSDRHNNSSTTANGRFNASQNTYALCTVRWRMTSQINIGATTASM